MKTVKLQTHSKNGVCVGDYSYKGRKIVTDFDMKPIPTRNHDWTATFDDYDGTEDSGCPLGSGATEREAIQDLVEQVED